MRRGLARLVPDRLRPALRRLYYLPVYVAHRLRHSGSDMIPPASLMFVGLGDFVAIGREFRSYFVELAGLRPEHRVLDVGCGIGRMAIPLTEHLSAEGGYWGFDIVEKGIAWCKSRITPRFPNFRFQHSDVYNRHYNPGGRVLARDYRFPFDDGFFDFVFLTSVFTHVLPVDLENYLREMARVLKPGGRCFATLFLLQEESLALLRAGRSRMDFAIEVAPGCLTISADDPETAIAYDEARVLALLERNGLRMRPPLHYGAWCGRERHLSFQDIVIAEKASTLGGSN